MQNNSRIFSKAAREEALERTYEAARMEASALNTTTARERFSQASVEDHYLCGELVLFNFGVTQYLNVGWCKSEQSESRRSPPSDVMCGTLHVSLTYMFRMVRRLRQHCDHDRVSSSRIPRRATQMLLGGFPSRATQAPMNMVFTCSHQLPGILETGRLKVEITTEDVLESEIFSPSSTT